MREMIEQALTLALSQGERGLLVHTPRIIWSIRPEAFEAFLFELKKQKSFSLDTETTNIMPRWAELVGLSFSWDENEAWYLPVRSPPDEQHLDLQATLNALRPVLEDPTVEKIGQNLKYDIIVLRGAGINLAGTAFDTMVASYLLDAGQRNHNLDDLALDYLGHTTIKISELIGIGQESKADGRGSHPAGGRLCRRRRLAARPSAADLGEKTRTSIN